MKSTKIEINSPESAHTTFKAIEKELLEAGLCDEFIMMFGVAMGALLGKFGPHATEEIITAWIAAARVTSSSTWISP